MNIICAWCGILMGVKAPLDDEGKTHGMCAECGEKFRATFQKKFLDTKNPLYTIDTYKPC